MDGLKKIVNRKSGKVLDLTAHQMASLGGQIQQWGYSTRRNQQWYVMELGAGEHKILSAQSGFALDADTGTINAPGTVVHQWQYHGGQNQRWKFKSIGDGWFHIVNSQSNSVLDANLFAIDQDGADIALFPDNGGKQQHWKLEDVTLGASADDQVAEPDRFNTEYKTEWRLAVIRKSRSFHYKINAGIDYASKSFNEAFTVDNGKLASWVVQEVSRYNVDNLSINADETSLTIKGKVHRDPGFGSGGSYKARVQVIFLVPVEVLTAGQQGNFAQAIQQFRFGKQLGADTGVADFNSAMAAAAANINSINAAI